MCGGFEDGWKRLRPGADGGDEAVAALGEGFDVAGVVGGVSEGFADFINGGAERVVEVDDGVAAPEAELEVVAGDDLAGALEERGEDFEGLALQLNPKTSLPEFSAIEVHLKESEGEFRIGDRGLPSARERYLAEMT